MRERTAGFRDETRYAAGPEFKQRGRRDGFPNQDGVRRKLRERGRRLRPQVMEHAADNIFEISAPLAEIVVLKAVIDFQKFVANLLDRPFGVDKFGLDLLDDPIDEET